MAAVFNTADDAAPCRLCGAALAPPGRFGACGDCDRRLRHENGHRDITEAEFVRLIARRLDRAATRIERGDPLERCQALSVSGYQCASYAAGESDGRLVCVSHRDKGASHGYVDAPGPDRYQRFQALLVTVAVADPRFAAAVANAAADIAERAE